MKQLVILSHPSGENLTNLVWSEIASFYEKHNSEIEVRDLYKMNFNPVMSSEDIAAIENGTASMEILEEQDLVRNSDILIFLYPVPRSGMPAMIKGYIDRVFSEGFAYLNTSKGSGKLLKGKKAVIVNTYEEYSPFYAVPFDNNMRTILESFGIEVIMHYKIDNFSTIIEQEILQTKINDLKTEIKRLLFLKGNSRLSIPTIFF